jgi:hypothetical protein
MSLKSVFRYFVDYTFFFVFMILYFLDPYVSLIYIIYIVFLINNKRLLLIFLALFFLNIILLQLQCITLSSLINIILFSITYYIKKTPGFILFEENINWKSYWKMLPFFIVDILGPIAVFIDFVVGLILLKKKRITKYFAANN